MKYTATHPSHLPKSITLNICILPNLLLNVNTQIHVNLCTSTYTQTLFFKLRNHISFYLQLTFSHLCDRDHVYMIQHTHLCSIHTCFKWLCTIPQMVIKMPIKEYLGLLGFSVTNSTPVAILEDISLYNLGILSVEYKWRMAK